MMIWKSRTRAPKTFRLTKEEQAIEAALLRGEYKPVSKAEFNRVKRAIKDKLAELKATR